MLSKGVIDIRVEAFTNTEAAAEGCTLGAWRYQELRDRTTRKAEVSLALHDDADT